MSQFFLGRGLKIHPITTHLDSSLTYGILNFKLKSDGFSILKKLNHQNRFPYELSKMPKAYPFHSFIHKIFISQQPQILIFFSEWMPKTFPVTERKTISHFTCGLLIFINIFQPTQLVDMNRHRMMSKTAFWYVKLIFHDLHEKHTKMTHPQVVFTSISWLWTQNIIKSSIITPCLSNNHVPYVINIFFREMATKKIPFRIILCRHKHNFVHTYTRREAGNMTAFRSFKIRRKKFHSLSIFIVDIIDKDWGGCKVRIY